MALDGDALGDAIHSAMQTAGLTNTAPGAPQPDPVAVWRTIGKAVVAYLTANASVSVPVDATDVGLQSYTTPLGAPAATTGPLAPTSLGGTIS